MSQLQIKNLFKQYGNNTVVNDLSIDVESGEMLSLLGPSGCGKTTTLRMIAGMQTPTSGSILLDNRDLTYVPPHQRYVGLVFQNYALFPHLNVYDNVAFGLRRHGVPKSEIRQRVVAALQSVQLSDYTERFPAQMSGGQQQRVALARTLVLKPPLVLFDEPLSNLDAKLRQALGIEIRMLQKEYGFTGIFVTHDQDEAMVLSDRIAVMRQGQIIQIGTPQQIYTQPADPFVADFVGESNLLPVSNVTVEKGRWRTEIANGQILRAEKSAATAPPTFAMVRPEGVQILPLGTQAKPVQGDEWHNCLHGTVSFIHYAGSSYLMGVTLEGIEKHFMVRIQDSQREFGLRVGDEAILQWDISRTLTF